MVDLDVVRIRLNPTEQRILDEGDSVECSIDSPGRRPGLEESMVAGWAARAVFGKATGFGKTAGFGAATGFGCATGFGVAAELGGTNGFGKKAGIC